MVSLFSFFLIRKTINELFGNSYGLFLRFLAFQNFNWLYRYLNFLHVWFIPFRFQFHRRKYFLRYRTSIKSKKLLNFIHWIIRRIKNRKKWGNSKKPKISFKCQIRNNFWSRCFQRRNKTLQNKKRGIQFP